MGKIFKDEQTKTKRTIISDDIRDIVYARANGRCFYCGKKLKKEEMSIEHIIPLQEHGSNDIKNLFCSCRKCNQEKGNNILMKHIIAMENFIHEQNEVINSKKDLVGKLLSVFENEVSNKKKMPILEEVGNKANEEEKKKKDQEINALKSERAKLLKDIKKLKDNEDNIKAKQVEEINGVKEQLNGVRTAYKKLQNDYKILEKELEENKNKAQVVVKKEEYEIRLKELTEKNKVLNEQINKKDKEIRQLGKEVKSRDIIIDRLKKQRDKKKQEEETKKKMQENLKIIEDIKKKNEERNNNLRKIFDKKR